MPAHQARPVVTETDLALSGGRTLHVYDTAGDGGEDRLTVFWHHGTPNLGPPPEPLFPAADRLGIRWVSYDRLGYGGSTPRPGRDLASAATDVAGIGDALGIGRFAGHSGGSNHALASGAPLPARGGSTRWRSACRCWWCTAARTGSCPAATAGGWPAGSPRPSCGDARRTATSRSSARPRRPLAGSGSTQAWG